MPARPSAPSEQRTAARPTAWIIGFVACLFFLAAPGQLTNVDSLIYHAQAESLWLGASLDIGPQRERAPRLGRAAWVEDRRGTVRGMYPIGTALALGPGIWLGQAVRYLTGWGKAAALVPSGWMCFLMGAGCWMLTRALSGLGVRPRVAVATALVVFLGDAGIWFVRGQIWSESVTAPALALSLLLLARWRALPGRARAFTLGSVLGALPWIHGGLWPVSAALCLLCGIEGMRSRPAGTEPLRGVPRDGWLVWLGGLWPAAMLLIYNAILFGAPVAGGYAEVAEDWIRARPGLLVVFGGLLRYHWPAALGIAGLVLWLRREGCKMETVMPLVAVACHLLLLVIWRTEQENQLQRFLIIESMLLAPALAHLMARLDLRGRLWLELPACALVGAGIISMLFDQMFITHLDVAGTTVTAPRVWWVMMGVRSGAVGWLLGALILGGAAACGVMVWRAPYGTGGGGRPATENR